MRFDSDSFLSQVKLIGSLPTGRFSDTEICSVASNQINSRLVPLILTMKEEYYLTSEFQAVTANQSAYPIPYRAMGLSLRDVRYNDLTCLRRLTQIDLRDATSITTGTPTSFYLQGQDVILYPTPSSTQGNLYLYYFLIPSSIVATASCGYITNIDRVTGIITAVTPSAWATSNTYDLVSSKNGHQTKAFDLVASAVTLSTSITFTPASIPSTIVVGDYVSLAGEAPFVQAPDVCFQYVIELTVNQLLKEMGDQAGMAASDAQLARHEQMIVMHLQNRVHGAPKRIRITL